MERAKHFKAVALAVSMLFLGAAGAADAPAAKKVVILGSLEFASKVSGAKLVVVLGHTSCGAIKGACDDVKLGNLTALIAKIKPAVDKVPNDGTDRSSKNYAFVDKVADQNVRLTVEAIRAKSPLLKEMEDKGEIKIVGAMYDLKTGKVAWDDAPAPVPPKRS